MTATNPIFPHGTAFVDKMPAYRVKVWVEKVRRLIDAGDLRTPAGILSGLGMDGDHQAQVLKSGGWAKA